MKKAAIDEKPSPELQERSRIARFNHMLGVKVAMARDIAGLSQDELAKMVGVSRVQITNIENGISGTPVHRLVEIARALGVKPARLLP